MSQAQQIAGAGGVLLIISLFLPWFGDFSGWEGQSSTDIYMLITGAVAIGSALGAGPDPSIAGVSRNGAATLLGGVATILLIWLIVFDFPSGVDRGIGIILALVGAAMIAWGSYRAGGGS